MMPLRIHILAFTWYDSLSCFLLAVFDKTLLRSMIKQKRFILASGCLDMFHAWLHSILWSEDERVYHHSAKFQQLNFIVVLTSPAHLHNSQFSCIAVLDGDSHVGIRGLPDTQEKHRAKMF